MTTTNDLIRIVSQNLDILIGWATSDKEMANALGSGADASEAQFRISALEHTKLSLWNSTKYGATEWPI